jgi:hypothetical protein
VYPLIDFKVDRGAADNAPLTQPQTNTKNMSAEFVLRERALYDDTLEVCDKGFHYQNGHATGRVLVTYWTFANEWCNHKHQFIAKTIENALKRYQRIKGMIDEETREYIYACLAE